MKKEGSIAGSASTEYHYASEIAIHGLTRVNPTTHVATTGTVVSSGPMVCNGCFKSLTLKEFYLIWFKFEFVGTNTCYPLDSCKTFKETFGTAKSFCSMIWDESFEVLDEDSEQKCFTFEFKKDTPNPNKQAWMYYKSKLNNRNKRM